MQNIQFAIREALLSRDPRWSVIVPTHARPEQLARCLASLTRVEEPDGGFEVIVIDDGSPQPLDEVVRPFQGMLQTTLIAQANAGPASARNTGAQHARGALLAFTDDDCEPSPTWLRALDRSLRQLPDAMLGGRTENALSANSCSQASQILLDYLYSQHAESGRGVSFFASNNLAMGKDRFETLGGFSSQFPLAAAEDRDLCARWIERGWPLRAVPDALVLHSHPLRFTGFCRQHFTYGRGARMFHRARAARGTGGLRIEPVRFYAGMLRHALRQEGGLGRRTGLAALLGVSQIANAAGYFWERPQ